MARFVNVKKGNTFTNFTNSINTNLINNNNSYTSKGNSIKNEVDDFWNDCVSNDQSNQNSKMMSNNNAEDYITFSNNIISSGKLKNSYPDNEEDIKNNKYLDLLQKYDDDNLITQDTIQKKQKDEEKKKKSMERCFILYERGKIKNEVNRIMYHKNEQLKIESEMKDCTWKPKTTQINKQVAENFRIVKTGEASKIFDRNSNWKNKNVNKNVRSKSVIDKENSDFTYKPNINETPNLNQMFNDNKTIYKDIGNRSFVFRLEKAREEQEDKKKRIERDLSGMVKDKWSSRNLNMNKSGSMKDMDAKETLRTELHSIKYEETEQE